jgi:hypothetical protein
MTEQEKNDVLRLNLPRLLAREIFGLSNGIFRKYPSQIWYICSILFNDISEENILQISRKFVFVFFLSDFKDEKKKKLMVFLLPKIYKLSGFERTQWKLFHKCVAHTKFDICIFIDGIMLNLA